jgi:Arc/MetJ-type ribon-helix-helix transcriptional regulator
LPIPTFFSPIDVEEKPCRDDPSRVRIIGTFQGEGVIVSKTYVETSTELLEGIDEMVREGYYANRTEGINDAIRLLLKQYKLSKLHAKDSVLADRHSGGEEGKSR